MYRLIKKYPGSPEVNSDWYYNEEINEYTNKDYRNGLDVLDVENNPEYWHRITVKNTKDFKYVIVTSNDTDYTTHPIYKKLELNNYAYNINTKLRGVYRVERTIIMPSKIKAFILIDCEGKQFIKGIRDDNMEPLYDVKIINGFEKELQQNVTYDLLKINTWYYNKSANMYILYNNKKDLHGFINDVYKTGIKTVLPLHEEILRGYWKVADITKVEFLFKKEANNRYKIGDKIECLYNGEFYINDCEFDVNLKNQEVWTKVGNMLLDITDNNSIDGDVIDGTVYKYNK